MSALQSLQEAFEGLHVTRSRQAKLNVFLRQLSVTSHRGSLKLVNIQQLIEETATPALASSGDSADAVSDLNSALKTEIDAGHKVLQDLSADSVSSLLSLLFVVGKDADAQLDLKARRFVEELQGLLSSVAINDSINTLLTTELMVLGQAPILSQLCLPHQLFNQEQRQVLASLLSSRPTLQYIDLSHCLLKDTFVQQSVVPAIKSMMHLSCLLLDDNTLTTATALEIEKVCNDKHACPSLQVVQLHQNDIAPQLLDRIEAVLVARRARPRALSTASDGHKSHLPPNCLSYFHDDHHSAEPIRILCFDGAAMLSAGQGHYVSQVREALAVTKKPNGDKMPLLDEVSVFVGSSFGAVVACAVALELPTDSIVTFFANVAEQIFVQGHYTYYVQAAGRSIRSWWTSGDYYSSSLLKVELEKLFGARTMFEFPSKEGKAPIDVILTAAHEDPNTPKGVDPRPQPTLFRSYHHKHLRLVDVLLACCATPQFFAHRDIDGKKLFGAEDIMPNPSVTALCEMAKFTSVSRLHLFNVGLTSTEHSVAANYLLLRAAAERATALAAAGKAKTSRVQEAPGVLRRRCIEALSASVADSLSRCRLRYVRQPLKVGDNAAIGLDEDNVFLINEVLAAEIAKSWIPAGKAVDKVVAEVSCEAVDDEHTE